MVGGESLCRHLLYTRAYMRRLFGLRPADVPIDWSPDTFGHSATAPTYLTRGGVKYLYLHRPGMQTASKPGAFWWEGPDGSRVLVRNDMELGYGGQIRPGCAGHLVKFVKLTGGRPRRRADASRHRMGHRHEQLAGVPGLPVLLGPGVL
jgi:alpha-mannosidase